MKLILFISMMAFSLACAGATPETTGTPSNVAPAAAAASTEGTPAPADAGTPPPAAAEAAQPSVAPSEPATAAAAPSSAAAPSAPPARHSANVVVNVSQINSGDTAWMLVATVLVLFMTLPGLALFYGGMVRKKNVLGMLMQCAGAAVIVSILWFVVGYSIAFTPGNGWVGGFDRILFQGVLHNKDLGTTTVSTLAPTVPEAVFVMYQLMFAIITVALIFGAFAERMRFSALLWFTALWTVMVYAPIAHWVWAPSGWLSALGILDFAGGMVVHVNAGFAGLAGAIALGPRIGYGREPLVPHNLGLTVIGACMLWVGWFGFNAGSALAADSRAAFAMLVTHLATAMAAFSWMIVEWMVRGRPSVLGIASGVVAGLVAITPAAGFVSPSSAAVIGFAAGIGCYWGATALKSLFNYDDSLDVFGIHAIGGIIGALLTGVFANHAIGGATGKVVTQLLGTATVAGYSFLATYIILRFVKIIVGLRVPMKIEHDGLDIGLHGESVE